MPRKILQHIPQILHIHHRILPHILPNILCQHFLQYDPSQTTGAYPTGADMVYPTETYAIYATGTDPTYATETYGADATGTTGGYSTETAWVARI